jgi:hypothetical protein
MAIKGDRAKFLSGLPILIPSCNVAMTQPKVRDICAFGEDDFFLSVNLFTEVDKYVEKIKMGNSQLSFYSDFQILMVILDQDISAKIAVLNLFELIFPDYKCELAPGSINFRNVEEEKLVGRLDPMNFEDFRDMLRMAFIPATGKEGADPQYNPADERAAEIAAKLKRGNDLRKQIQAKTNEGKAPSSLFATYVSALSVGLSMDINIFFEYTPYQLYDSFLRYNKKSAYDLYQKVSTTPLMDTSKMEEPDMWIGDIY